MACRPDPRDWIDTELRVELDRTLDGVLAMLESVSRCDYHRNAVNEDRAVKNSPVL